jgi:hypothetical protein
MSTGLKKKELRLVLKQRNSATITTAVLFRCVHFPEKHGALMALQHAIAHWTACKPFKVATTITAMELAANGDG